MMSVAKRARGPAACIALALFAAAAPALARAIAAPHSRAIAAPAALNLVRMKGMAFSVPAMKVKVGTTVTWTNTDQVPHNVVARDGSFHSKFLTSGDSFNFKFTKKGEYAYYCAIHPQMVGKIIVT